MPDKRPRTFMKPERVDYTNMERQVYGISPLRHNVVIRSEIPVCKEISTQMNRIFADVTLLDIKKVIFNNPATIVLWEDGTKTVVKCDGEKFDREKGLAMVISKKAMGNTGRYFEVFKKWIKDDEKSNAVKWCPTCKYLSVDADEIPCNICIPNDNKWKKA